MTRLRLGRAAAAAVTVVFLLPGTASGATKVIKGTNSDRWMPSHRYIERGDRITWTNPSDKMHDVFKWKGDWKRGFLAELEPGDKVSKRFTRAGNYYFRCAIHSSIVDRQCRGMCGIVHVAKPSG